MAYVNVAEWKPEQVTEWLKGLDSTVLSYIQSFLNNEVSGQQLLNLRPDDLDHLGVHKLGHQELILEAVEHLRNFHYELDRENLQLLALRLSCRARSLHNELRQHTDSQPVSTQTLADVADVITAVKPLVCWLDRSPFTGQLDYQDRKSELLKLSLAIATCAQRDRFAERPVEAIRTSCKELARLADSIIQDIMDPLILQPASLDLATLKKRAGDDLGFFIVPSFHGIHQIGGIKFSSPAHQCGKIEEGDEVVQVNYQTVVGWQTKRVMALFQESPTDIFLTLKKRPRHTKVYGQIYMKPYRLPSKKRAAPYIRWHDNLPSPRPELLTIPDFEMPQPRAAPKQMTPQPVLEGEPLASNSSSDDDDDSFLPGVQDEGQTSPTSMRLYLPKPRVTVQRRATVTGASPTNKRPPVNIEQFWRELRLERQWKDGSPSAGGDSEGRKDEVYQLRDKSASFGNDLSVSPSPRPTTCLGIENTSSRMQSGKKLRIMENRNNMHTTENCDEIPRVDSVKENIACGKEKSKKEEEKKRTERESENMVSAQAEEVFCVRGQNKITDNENLQNSSALCTSSDVDVSTMEVGLQQHSRCSERWNDEKGDCCQGARIGHGNEVSLTHVACEEGGPENCVQETLVFCSNDARNTSERGIVQDKGTDKNILRAKGEGCGLPTSDLNDVCQAAEDTDKVHRHKNAVASVENTVFVHKERGRLDKSYSTPAYDLTDSNAALGGSYKTSFVEDWINCRVSENGGTLPSPTSESSSHAASQLQKQNQVVAESDKTPDTASSAYAECSDICAQDGASYSLEDNQTQRIGEILETINIALLQHRIKEQSNINTVNDFRKSLEQTDLSSHIINDKSTKKDEASCETNAQPCFFSNGSTGLLNAVHSALIKDGSNKDSEISVEGDLKGSVIEADILPSAQVCTTQDFITAQSEVWQKVPEPQINIKPPHTEEKQHRCTEELTSHVPETDISHIRICVTPPEPPPRPDHPKGVGSMGYRAIIAARSLGRNAGSKSSVGTGGNATFPSPRSTRKMSHLLAKKRNISVRDLGVGDREGWLLHRCRSGGAGAVWLRAWFVLKGTIFYGFKTPQSAKADIMISLPGFTASLADEVKSRRYAFKVYHTGTVFYFAAESEEELSLWMDCITLATFKQDFSKMGQESEVVFFSETDEESETDMESEMCFPSPKMSRFVGFLSSSGPQQHEKQSYRSHQNLATESKSQESQKKFGSLRKLGRKTSEQNSASTGQEMSGIVAAASSLDRKYLRFLGSRNNIVPVPTPQFRSYRRVPNGPAPTPQNKTVNDGLKQAHNTRPEGSEQRSQCLMASAQDTSFKSSNETSNVTPQQKLQIGFESVSSCTGSAYQSAESGSVLHSSSERESRTVHDTRPLGDISNEGGPNVAQGVSKSVREDRIFKPQERMLPLPMKRHLKVDFRDRQIHSSNPSLQLPSDMADYRLTAERLREFGIRRTRQREDTSGFVTLKEFMLSRQEEEKQQNSRAAQRAQPKGNNEGYTEDLVTINETAAPSQNSSSSSNKTRNLGPSVARRGSFNGSRMCRNNNSDLVQGSQDREYRGGSPEKLWISSLRRDDDKVKTSSQGSYKNPAPDHSAWNSQSLKAAAQYQPPPVSQSVGSSRNVHPNDEAPRMKLAFEMHLGNNRSPTISDKDKDSPPSKSSKFRNFFSSSKSQHQKQNFLELPNSQNSHRNQHKTILGSPRLHRAIFRDKKNHGPKSSSVSDSSSSSVSSPTSATLCDWTADDYGCQMDPSMAQFKKFACCNIDNPTTACNCGIVEYPSPQPSSDDLQHTAMNFQ